MPISRSARAACVVVLTTIGTAGLTANATDLFIGGTIGEIYLGDSRTGGFELFGGNCLDLIQALALDDASIYAGDLGGGSDCLGRPCFPDDGGRHGGQCGCVVRRSREWQDDLEARGR